MSGMPLGGLSGVFFSSSALARFVFVSLWAPRSPLNSSTPVLASISPPPDSPKDPFESPNVPVYTIF